MAIAGNPGHCSLELIDTKALVSKKKKFKQYVTDDNEVSCGEIDFQSHLPENEESTDELLPGIWYGNICYRELPCVLFLSKLISSLIDGGTEFQFHNCLLWTMVIGK
jgi:hypothetical protein